MKSTTARRFGSNGKSFTAPSAVAPTIGAALLASGTSEAADTAWSPSAACLLPDILPVAGTLLSYGGSRQLAAGGAVTHSGALTLGGALTLPGNPSSALHAAPKQYVDSAVGAVDLSGRVPYTGATGAVNLGANAITCGAITASGAVKIGTTYQWLGTASGFFMQTPSVANHFAVRSDGTELSSTGRYGHNSGAVNSGMIDIAWGRDSAGVGAVYTTASGSTLAGFKCGAITASGIVRAGSQTGDYTAVEYYGSTYKTAVLSGYGLTHYADAHSFRGASGAPGVVRFIGMGVMLGAVNTTGSDIGLIRSSPTVLDIQANGGLRVRNFADSADAALTCGAITASDVVTATSSGLSCEVDPVNWRFRLSTSGTSRMDLDQYSLRLLDSALILWSNTGNNVNTIKLLGLCKNDTTHVLQINNGTEGTLNGLECSTITASGAITSPQFSYPSLLTVGCSAGSFANCTQYGPSGVIHYGPHSFFGAIQETPTQSVLDPTTANIPTGKRQGWYNTALSEFRDWVNIGGTLLKSAAYT